MDRLSDSCAELTLPRPPLIRASHIPLPFQTLMLEDTDLKHYYPEDFEVDLNGHKASWKGVAKLPFIDTQVLRIKLSQVWNDVTKWDMGDRNRNRHGFARLLVKRGHNLYPELERVQRDPRRGAVRNSLGTHTSTNF